MTGAGLSSAAEPDMDRATAEDVEIARTALAVWSSEPPYGTSRRDTTLARAAAVHLSNVLRALDAERPRRIEAEAALASWKGAYKEQRRMFAEWLDDKGYEKPDAWQSSGSAAPLTFDVSETNLYSIVRCYRNGKPLQAGEISYPKELVDAGLVMVNRNKDLTAYYVPTDAGLSIEDGTARGEGGR